MKDLPVGVKFVALMHWFGSIACLLIALAHFSVGATVAEYVPTLVEDLLIFGAAPIFLGLGTISGLIGKGLWKGKHLALAGAILLALCSSLGALIHGSYGFAFFHGGIFGYLVLSREVRRAFRR